MINLRFGALVVVGALIACGDDGTARPVTELDVRDLREEQARSRPAGDVLAPMLASTQPDRVIYDAPVDLTREQQDSVVTAPLGITPRTDSPARPGGGDTSSARRTPARGDTAARRDST